MSPIVASLLCLGLCVGQKIPSPEGLLFRPSIRAVPGSVVPRGAEVKFSCQGPQGSKSFQLWKDGNFLLQINTTRGEADFHLLVKGANAIGYYNCRYWQGPDWSEFSAPLQLVVIGFFSKPFLKVQSGTLVPAGETVTLTCQIFLAGEKNIDPQRKDSRTVIIVTVSCVSIFLLLLLLFLLVLFCHRHTQRKSSHGDTPRSPSDSTGVPQSVCLTSLPTEKIIYEDVSKGRQIETQASESEDPHGVTYSQLNTAALSETQRILSSTAPEPVIYSTVALH
ncbi:natural cytotoxicity triggering receptor 1-like isoform X4 [Sminthopsis crassicaudata]|uniref:natural cytotoxicity triggering receptor 1-like isoform X4 n=1 Tax=Sminthopsis crassicaudata TaxID=9301 RepID=UPI003D681C11